MNASSTELPSSHPDVWHRQPAQLPQRCSMCKMELVDEDITDVRGAWEHYECLRALWFQQHNQERTIWQGKQKDLLEAINSGQRIHCWFDRTVKQTEGRYFWEVLS